MLTCGPSPVLKLFQNRTEAMLNRRGPAPRRGPGPVLTLHITENTSCTCL